MEVVVEYRLECEVKCPECNYETTFLYDLIPEEEEAKATEPGPTAVCANCLMDRIKVKTVYVENCS